MRDPRELHALTWGWWALAAVATIQLASNPAYVLFVAAVAWMLVAFHARPGPLAKAFPVLVTVAVVFVVVRVVLTALTTQGGENVLFQLPSATLPAVLGGFTVGGAVSGEVIQRSLIDGLVIIGVVAAFAAFNAIVSHDELVRSAPRAFHEVGLIVTVALAFVPSTIAAVAAVREADRARTGGRTVRRGRLLRLVVPLLENGMERAMNLAESMDSRGFAHHGPGPAERRAGWLALTGLIGFGAAFAALVGRQRPTAAGLALAGLVATVAAVWLASARSPRPRYRTLRPRRQDLAVMGLTALAPAAVAVLAVAGEPSLRWDPTGGPPLVFEPAVAAALALLAAPALWARRPAASGRTTESGA